MIEDTVNLSTVNSTPVCHVAGAGSSGRAKL